MFLEVPHTMEKAGPFHNGSNVTIVEKIISSRTVPSHGIKPTSRQQERRGKKPRQQGRTEPIRMRAEKEGDPTLGTLLAKEGGDLLRRDKL